MSEPTIAVSQLDMSKNSSSGCSIEQRGGEKSAEEGADDPDDRGHDEPTRVVAREDCLCDRAADQAQNDKRNDPHVSPFRFDGTLFFPAMRPMKRIPNNAPDDYRAPKTASNPEQRVYQRVEAQQ